MIINPINILSNSVKFVSSPGKTSKQLTKVHFFFGVPSSVPCDSNYTIVSNPSKTRPKTTCCPSSQEVTAVVIKNWEEFVSGP